MNGLRALVVGSGAREHALCWRLAAEGAAKVIVAPGNPLMRDVAGVRDDVSADDHRAIAALAAAEKIELVVVGPEAPLAYGLADTLTAADVACFGPTAAAARLEASKSFAREICLAAGVPVATGAAFNSIDGAVEYAATLGAPVVVKADGLAGGKGVTICQSPDDAERSIRQAMEEGRFGASGRRVVIEGWLEGVEASVIAICDGRRAVLLPAARDHKRLLDGDLGPNTGGMGAFSPVPELPDAALEMLRGNVFEPVLAEMARRGTPFRGALFAGLMLTADGPRVLEFNCRFGDPETQALLPRLAEPITPLLVAAATETLAAERPPVTAGGASVAVTLAAAGYPDSPRAGDVIEGIDGARAVGAHVFGAGVGTAGDRGYMTAGGRVLTVVGLGGDVGEAAARAYEAAHRISFSGRVMREDIGRVALGAAA